MAETQTRTQYAYATRLSEHLAETPENYLLCTRCVLCRSGYQTYSRQELGLESGPRSVDVLRPVSAVTSKSFLGSLIGKGVTLRHPVTMLSATTHADQARGVVLAARVAAEPDSDGNILVEGDLLIYDPSTIALIKSGSLRELSVGYLFTPVEGENGLEMEGLVANHVAIVERGRAGNAMIIDALPLPAAPIEDYTTMMRRFHRINAKDASPPAAPVIFSYDNDISPLINEIQGGDDQEENNMDNARMEKLCQLLEALIAKMGGGESSANDLTEPGTREKPDTFTDLIPVAALPEADRPRDPTLDSLRALRPFIQASGDARAIDAFNDAMRAAKSGIVGPGQRLIAAHDRQNSQQGDYENSVLRARARMLGQAEPAARPCRSSLIVGDHRQGEVTFQEMCDRKRTELLAKK